MRLNLAVHTYQSWVEAHFKSSVWRYIHISRGLRLTLSEAHFGGTYISVVG